MGTADRHLGKVDCSALQAAGGFRDHIAAVDDEFRAEFLQRHDQQIDRRVPMAQPPGSETLASCIRASSGAITQKLARIRDTSS